MLPYSGGLLEQPAGVVLRMERVFDARGAIEDKEHKKAEAKAKLSGI